jgi:hypothetical protein
MGFPTTLDVSIVVVALQSFKELEGWPFSFEISLPPWGSYPFRLCLLQHNHPVVLSPAEAEFRDEVSFRP